MRRQRLKITFLDAADVDTVATAMIGGSYNLAARECKRTKGEVAYRLKVARGIKGLPHGVGFAKQWRDGASDFARELRRQLLTGMRSHLMRELSHARAKPRAKGASE